MENKKIKWLIYTFLVGLIPIISRVFAWLITKLGTVDLFTANDFISFGLVLHISNINEIENLDRVSRSWKTVQNGISIFFIAIYSVLFTFGLLGNGVVDGKSMLNCAVALSIVSSFLSFSVYHYLSDLERAS